MGEQIEIDKALFSTRLSSFYSAWKADKRSGSNQVFAGASSILILMGRTEEANSFQKNNAMHVSAIGIALRFGIFR
jgi:nucleosome binding factor SPN SPT16 subunit